MRQTKAMRLFLLCGAVLGVGTLAARGLLRPNPYAVTQNGFTLTRQWDVEPPPIMPAIPRMAAPTTVRWEPFGVGPFRNFRIVPRLYTAPPTYLFPTGGQRENPSRAPWYPALEIGLPPELASMGLAYRMLRAEGVSSTGDTFPLAVAGDQFHPITSSVFVSLPPVGIPATYRWIDVTLRRRDTNQTCGTWRVFDLPRLRHALRPEEAGQGSVFVPIPGAANGKGIRVEARAWQVAPRPDVNRPDAGRYTLYPFERPVEAELTTEADPALFHTPYEAWDVRIKSLIPEWDAPDRLASGSFAPNSRAALAYRTGSASMQSANKAAYANALFADAPTPVVQHVARIEAELVRRERLVEDVTFSNISFLPLPDGHFVFKLPHGVQTITTPSGVRVTLHALPERDYFWWNVPVSWRDKTVEIPYLITFQPAPEAYFADLPRSPLLQKNGPPVKISASLAPRDDKSEVVIHGWTTGYQTGLPVSGHERGGFMVNVDQLQKRLTFGFRITQERTHETVPVSLTIPVQAQPPAPTGRKRMPF